MTVLTDVPAVQVVPGLPLWHLAQAWTWRKRTQQAAGSAGRQPGRQVVRQRVGRAARHAAQQLHGKVQAHRSADAQAAPATPAGPDEPAGMPEQAGSRERAEHQGTRLEGKQWARSPST